MFNFRKLELNPLNKNLMERPLINNMVYKTATQSDGKILIGGSFTNYEGTLNRNYLVRLNADKTVDTTFCTNAVDVGKFNAFVQSILVQPDGKILIGGSFTNYGGTTGRDYLIRLNSDGTLDTAFCANATDGGKFTSGGSNGGVTSMTLQSDGKILIVGAFLGYGSTAGRAYLIRLNSDGTLDTAFCNNATDSNKFNNPIDIALVQPDGKIVIAGGFSSYAGTSGRNFFIRLNSTGTTDTAFCANATDGAKIVGSPNTAALQSDGKILFGGGTQNYGGVTGRNRLLRFNSDGTLDTVFCNNATDGTKFNSHVYSIVVQPDTKILIGGPFTAYAGTTGRDKFIRLNSNGTLDTTFCNNATDGTKFSDTVGGNTINIFTDVQPDGKILVGGNFLNYAGVTGRNCLIHLNADGTLNTASAINTQSIYKFSGTAPIRMAYQPSGKLLVVGNFLNYGTVYNRNYLLRFNTDGTLDTAFCANATDSGKFNNSLSMVASQSDGKILVSGNFTGYSSVGTRSRFVRLNSDGTVDAAFCVNATDGTKFSAAPSVITVQSDGKILVGGSFTNYAGTTGRSYLIRLNSDGTLDTAFCVNATDGTKFSSTPMSVTVQPDGKILVGGNFLNYAGTTGRSRFIRLNSDGTLDTTFCSNASDGTKFSSAIQKTAVQSDGKIVVGGNFINYAGTTGRNYCIRLNSDGTLDTPFCINATDGNKFVSIPTQIVIEPNGKILVGGTIANYGGTTGRNRLIRLNNDGTLDTLFCNNVSDGNKISGTPLGLEQTPDGRITVLGNFTNYKMIGIKSLNYIFKINEDGLMK